MSDPPELLRIAERIETDEDFAMRVGEDPRAALEGEGVPDAVIARVLAGAVAEGAGTRGAAEVVGFAMPADAVGDVVSRIAAAARAVAGG